MTAKEGKPGTTDQRPRWEGPPETRPRGYLPAKDDPETDRDAAGENLQDPDRSSLGDAVKTRSETVTHKKDTDRIHEDAKPQFVRTRKGAGNSGVSSAEPRVITGDEDATFTTHPDRERADPRPDARDTGSGS